MRQTESLGFFRSLLSTEHATFEHTREQVLHYIRPRRPMHRLSTLLQIMAPEHPKACLPEVICKIHFTLHRGRDLTACTYKYASKHDVRMCTT